jgi:hypothetical protein
MLKNICFIGLLAIGLIFSTACDKIENAYPEPETELDVTLYPGNWSDYMANEYPNFGDNSSQPQNVLLEEYTGHTCNACPNAAIVAFGIQENNPNRVFVVSIHAGPGGMTFFQQYNPNASSFYTNHTNNDGLTYGEHFQNGFNFLGNPSGTVNRQTVDNRMFDFSGTWSTRTANLLANTDIKIRMQSAFNYFETTNGGYLHVELEKTANVSDPINTVVYVVQDTLVDWQVMPNNSYNPDYVHKNRHLGSIDNRPFGRVTFNSSSTVGEKVILDYAYKLPDDIAPDNLHFIMYAYNTETYEIYQVIKQRITL